MDIRLLRGWWVVAVILSSTAAQADYDLGLSTGYVHLDLKETNVEGREDERLSLDGQSYGMTLHRGITTSLTGFLGAQSVAVYLEKERSHVARYGPLLGLAYHLLGGTRRLALGREEASAVRTHRYSLSATAMAQLDIIGTQTDTYEFKANVVNIRGGLEMLVDVSKNHAIGMATYVSWLSLPMGTRLVSEVDREVAVQWRFWLE